MDKSIQNVQKQIAPFIHRTPVFTSSSLDEMIGCELYLNVRIFSVWEPLNLEEQCMHF